MVKPKKPLYERIGEEAINETITAGLSLLIIFLGVNYFNLKYAWVKIIETLGQQTGLASTGFANELSMMLSSLAQTFPFNIILGKYNLIYGFVIGFVILIVGVTLKLLTNITREQFIIDIGRNIYVPAIIGFVSLLILQFVLAVSIDNQNIVNNLENSLFVWKTYGQLIIIGITTLILGSIVRLISNKQKSPKLRIVGSTLVYGAYVLLSYYLVLRIISMEFILNSALGNFFKVFLISGDFSTFVIIFCVFMFMFGVELKKYGYYLLHKRNATLYHHELPKL